MGISFENPDQYIGGSGGGSVITLPAALTGLAGLQLDNSTTVQTIPNLHPDIIAKIAYYPSPKAHIEIAGIERTFKVWNITTGQPTSAFYFTKAAGGGAINANFEVVKNVRLFTNNLWGPGVGRFFFGNAPDLIIRANGDISPIHSGGMVQGVEATHDKWLFYAYYGATYIDRDVAIDTNGNQIGYGYRGAPNSQNRTIQEATVGFNQTVWKDPRYGAINFMGQYAYFFRNPWYVAPNAPKATHLNTLFFNLRYTLPGAPPPAR